MQTHFMRILKFLMVLLITAFTVSVGYASPPIIKPAAQKVQHPKKAKTVNVFPEVVLIVQPPGCTEIADVYDFIKTQSIDFSTCCLGSNEQYFDKNNLTVINKPNLKLQGYRYLRWC